MRLSLIFSAIVGIACASPSQLVSRDFDTVNTALTNVTDSVKSLSSVANSGNADPATLLKASDGIVQAIQVATATVNATSNLTYIETVHLIAPVHKMSELSADLTNNMVKLKSSIETQKLCMVVQLQIANINKGATSLIAAVNSRVPASALEISEALSEGITDSLKSIQDDFSTENCVNGRNVTTTSASSRLGFGPSNVFFSLALGLVTTLALF
ncbi:cell wall protein [Beauveria brongniartii RCEF 3172]|uniref:Cell wall protein n=1 Tax=Beauveria brongniartii RCEF 3172 TaxID=1081107 RepID=A0A162I0Q4_9HYPO|nr:cell wall protein [Beauveria brongniartii RCEF 3172]